MPKPRKTVADYMVIALSPVLIMMLVGSLCFFLIEVFYRGQMIGGVCWVMFWFIIGIVLVSRIAIEQGTDYAMMYGLGLALATLLYMMRTQPSYLVGVVLLIIVWFSAHKLVWDCTLIDEDQDSSGQGLLQKTVKSSPSPPVEERAGERIPSVPSKTKPKPAKKPPRKISAPESPGRWVVYFSLAALPLFGVGQMLLPFGATADRRMGFIFLVCYLTAALGLLVTTSFLGLRRYLRQRYLKMPPAIAVAWLKFGVGVALIVLIGAIFLPRPGANEAWASLRYQIDYQLHRASQYATPPNAPGQGDGHPGSDSGGQKGAANTSEQDQSTQQAPGQPKPGEAQSPSQPIPAPAAASAQVRYVYLFLRTALWAAAIIVVGGWIIRSRDMLREMLRSALIAITEFFRKLFDFTPSYKPAKRSDPEYTRGKLSSFAQYRNPFYAAEDYAWPSEQIIIYTYEAIQVWAKEQGIPPRPEETAREFCARLGENRPELDTPLEQLSRLYAHAAYGLSLPPHHDLEPIKELWRRLPAGASRPAQHVG